VISGYGRMGKAFATQALNVRPDIIATAKGINNGALPMGAVLVRREVHDAFMAGPETIIELFHGYTCSGHPAACAAGLATMDIMEREGLFTRVSEIEPYWQKRLHELESARHVIDVRNLGLIGGIELSPREGAPGARGYEAFTRCFDAGALIRVTGDIIALSPPLTIEESHIDRLVDTIGTVLAGVD
jgi:beta-alanine--pyruvate transaminase